MSTSSPESVTLPSITVTTEQAQRIMAAFEGETNTAGEPLTAAAAYRRWVRRQLRERVVQRDLQTVDAEYLAKRQQVVAAVDQTLPAT